MAAHNELGKKGEELSEKYLEDKGYEILARNWVSGSNELDIVARKDNFIVVVEVKTRRSAFFGEPEESVTRSKQKAIIRAANAFVMYKKINLEVRFDIISVILSDEQFKIYHIEDAFHPVF